MSVSILILTLDEEQNLPGCLESIAWCDDVVVLDSVSRDKTPEIAGNGGARVVQRPFDNYAGQRNFGLTQIAYKYPWVLMLDADERVPAELRDEILASINGASPTVALFSMRRKDYFLGRWIRRSSGYPTWFGRLARVGRVWVERPINEEYRTDGETLMLKHHLHHYPFNKGFSAWIAKHDRYSSMEAALLTDATDTPLRFSELVSRDATLRRKAIKRIAYRLPGRPLLMFFALYLVRGGLLEGRAGLTFSALRAWYEFMIDCKTIELRRRRRHQPV